MLVRGKAFLEHAQAYGQSMPALLGKYDPATCSLRTSQRLLFEGSQESLQTLPRWGWMRDGACWGLMMSGPYIIANASGFLPTPTVSDANGSGRFQPRNQVSDGQNQSLRDYFSLKHNWLYPPVVIVEWLMGYPIGFTAFEPLAMGRYHSWQQQHGACLEARNVVAFEAGVVREGQE